jgi:hypothetical protein
MTPPKPEGFNALTAEEFLIKVGFEPTINATVDFINLRVAEAVRNMRFAQWVYVVDRLPKKSGGFYTNNEGHISMRYFDDSDKSFWLPTRKDGWIPNGSFSYWLDTDLPEIRTPAPKGEPK